MYADSHKVVTTTLDVSMTITRPSGFKNLHMYVGMYVNMHIQASFLTTALSTRDRQTDYHLCGRIRT